MAMRTKSEKERRKVREVAEGSSDGGRRRRGEVMVGVGLRMWHRKEEHTKDEMKKIHEH